MEECQVKRLYNNGVKRKSRAKPDSERFWSKVDKTDCCWVWVGRKDKKGYGRFDILDGSGVLAHRWSWIFFNGPISGGLCACHKCDNPSCVNPEHLFLGTNADNVKDKVSKGRQSYGEHASNSILKELQVLEIIDALNEGSKSIDLARKYGVSKSCIAAIKAKRKWKHLTGIMFGVEESFSRMPT